jgi:hypothetical protein
MTTIAPRKRSIISILEKLTDCKEAGVDLLHIPLDLTIEEFLLCPIPRLKVMADEMRKREKYG